MSENIKKEQKHLNLYRQINSLSSIKKRLIFLLDKIKHVDNKNNKEEESIQEYDVISLEKFLSQKYSEIVRVEISEIHELIGKLNTVLFY